jgi:RNA recognition motif-containing protein
LNSNHQMSTKLFVGNLSFNTTENSLHEAFSAHGNVVEANLMMDRMTGRSRGFAFVTYSTPEEAQKAIEAMSGAQLDGRALTVNVARPKEERPPGGGGGGRDRGPRREFGGGGGGGRGGYGGGGGGGGGRDRY